jgi:hypothetical protein
VLLNAPSGKFSIKLAWAGRLHGLVIYSESNPSYSVRIFSSYSLVVLRGINKEVVTSQSPFRVISGRKTLFFPGAVHVIKNHSLPLIIFFVCRSLNDWSYDIGL